MSREDGQDDGVRDLLDGRIRVLLDRNFEILLRLC